MGKMSSLLKKGWSFLIYVAMAGLILSGCATLPENQAAQEKAQAPVIQSVEVRPSAERVVVEFISSEPAPYAAFKLLDPLRIVLDIRGELDGALQRVKDVYVAGITDIRLEEGKTQSISSRAVIGTNRPVDFDVRSSDNVITVTITPEKDALPLPDTAQKAPAAEERKGPVTPQDPRIFFKERPGDLTQILGLDFTLLGQGKSRLIVTTDKKARYDLNQKGPKSLLLNITQATIPPLIMRHMDSMYFEGAVELVKTSLSPADQGVSMAITLREMVPYHVKQSETELTIDFGPTTVGPPEKRIVPLRQTQTAPGSAAPMIARMPLIPGPGQPLFTPLETASTPGAEGEPVIVQPIELEDPRAPRVYTGTRMTMDFVNADVTNVLRLIGEVSNLNIVWGPEVRGTVSMRLKDIPWDQALDLILENNNLGKRQSANVIWVAPKGVIQQLETAEKDRIDEYNARLRAQRRQKEEEKAQEPLVTEYIPVNFAKVEELKEVVKAGIGFPSEKDYVVIEPGEESLASNIGRMRKISADVRTNTFILTDLVSNVQKAKDVVRQFDTPVKQVMIEARIVDATDQFTRDLGVRWDNFQIQRRNDTAVPFASFESTLSNVVTQTNPARALQKPGDPSGFPPGGRLTSPGFVSNSPEGWAPNLGLLFSNLSASGLTATVLDAKLALSEAEGTSKTISAPKVIAMNGQTATISRGDSIIIPATENVESTTLDATLSLEVTPTVSFNDFITLEIKVTDDNAPSNIRILKKSIQTKLLVKNGDTIVIGGIYTEFDGVGEDGIPGLRRIPLLGWLFKAQTKSINKTELLIFLTPTVLKSYTKL